MTLLPRQESQILHKSRDTQVRVRSSTHRTDRSRLIVLHVHNIPVLERFFFQCITTYSYKCGHYVHHEEVRVRQIQDEDFHPQSKGQQLSEVFCSYLCSSVGVRHNRV